MTDFLDYYDLEKYLFEKAGPKFIDSGDLESVDFFLILHWKSPRAKTKNRDKLKERAGGFDKAVKQIADGLKQASSPEARLKFLIENWNLRLPTATAVLTVLYPCDFTVYDVRVRGQLGFGEINLALGWDAIWKSYLQYRQAVLDNGPSNYSLRNKDRYFWGKSLFEDADRDWRK